VTDPALIDPRLAEDTRLAMRLSSMGRAARSKAGIKVRQPLASVAVKLRAAGESESLSRVAPQLMDELNVRRIDLIDREGEVLQYTVRPNMPLLGPKYGPELPGIASALAAADPAEVAGRVGDGLQVEAGGYTLEPGEVLVTGSDREGYSVASDAGYTVAVRTTVTPELVSEGLARELVHRVQNLRRSAGFDIADYIVTYYRGGPDLEAVLSTHGEYVRQETLSVRLVNDGPAPDAYSETHEIDGLPITLGVLRHSG
jgi:isoleucyl-tRNA synthetase